MQVAVYPSPYTGTPYLCILYPALDSIEAAAERVLEPAVIPYSIVNLEDLPQNAAYTFQSLTVDLSGPDPVYDYDLPYARKLAVSASNSYWDNQYNEGLYELGATDADVLLALTTPEGSRTPDQAILADFVSEINSNRVSTNAQLAAATTGDDLNLILSNEIG